MEYSLSLKVTRTALFGILWQVSGWKIPLKSPVSSTEQIFNQSISYVAYVDHLDVWSNDLEKKTIPFFS